MTNRNWKIYLEDILDSVKRIESYTDRIDFDGFQINQMVIDAVIRNLEIIGEACKHIPMEIRENYDDVPWKAIIGLRNVAIHEYFGLDLENIWKIIKEDLPENVESFNTILKNE